MPLAKLSIDLEARLAGLQQGLDKAGVLAEKQAAQISAAFGKANAAASALGATLGAALGAAGITALLRSTVDGLDKLNDLSESVGGSVENLSALEDVALRTGGSLDTVGTAIVRMNKSLADAKPGSDMAATFAALGLSVEKLKAQDPAVAFQQLARALDGFADDANKARIVQDLFGKSLLEVNPLLKDVAASGQLVAKVTKEQAAAATQFNDAVASLQKDALDLARTLSGPLVDAINELFGVLKGSGPGALNQYLAVPLQAVSVLGANVAFVIKGIGTEIGGIAAQAAAVARLDFKGAETIGELMRQDAKAAREEFDKLERRLLAIGSVTPADYSNEGRNSPRAARPSLPASISDAGGTGKARGRSGANAPYPVDSLLVYQAEQLREAFEAIDKVNREWEPVTYVNSADVFEAELLRKAFEEIDEFNKQAVAKVETVGKVGKEVGEDLALVFSSAAGEAITKFEGLKGVLKGILADINQIAVRELITKPLSGFLTESLKGFSLTSLLGAANGAAFAGGGAVHAFAAGGVVNGATPFRFGAGKLGVMGEAGPEAILPLAKGRNGKLGVRAEGGGGRATSITYAPTIHIDSRTDQAAIAQTVAQAVQAGQQQLMQQLKDSGAL